jgi:hypothetical protein
MTLPASRIKAIETRYAPLGTAALAAKPLQSVLPLFLLRGERRALPVPLVLRCPRGGIGQAARFVASVARQASSRAVALDRRVLCGVGVPLAARRPQLDVVELSMARHAEGEVVLDVFAVQALDVGVEVQALRRGVRPQRGLSSLSRPAALAPRPDVLARGVVRAVIGPGRTNPFSHAADRTNAPHSRPSGRHCSARFEHGQRG